MSLTEQVQDLRRDVDSLKERTDVITRALERLGLSLEDEREEVPDQPQVASRLQSIDEKLEHLESELSSLDRWVRGD